MHAAGIDATHGDVVHFEGDSHQVGSAGGEKGREGEGGAIVGEVLRQGANIYRILKVIIVGIEGIRIVEHTIEVDIEHPGLQMIAGIGDGGGLNFVAHIDGVGAGGGVGGTHGGVVNSIGDGGAVGVASLEEGGEGHLAIVYIVAGGEIDGDVCVIQGINIAVGFPNPTHKVVAGIGNSAELHGVAFDILVGAGGGDGGTHGSVSGGESHRQRVGHIGAHIQIDIIDIKHISRTQFF